MLNLLRFINLQINGGTNAKQKKVVEIESMSDPQIRPLSYCPYFELHTLSVSLTHIFA